MTADEVVACIRAAAEAQGISWRSETVDTIKTGDRVAEVKGIATTGMATFAVLKQAKAAGLNFVLTHEPTFYAHLDLTEPLNGDPVYEEKQRFVRDNDMIVMRFHDHAHGIRPEPFFTSITRMLGWEKLVRPDDPKAPPPYRPRIADIPPTKLRNLASDIARRMNSNAVRVVGDPDMTISTVAFSVGSGIPVFPPDVDLVLGGELEEAGSPWDLAHYILDAASLGTPKALLVLPHLISEDPGMREIVPWVRSAVPGLPVEFIAAGEPYLALP